VNSGEASLFSPDIREMGDARPSGSQMILFGSRKVIGGNGNYSGKD